MSTREVAILAIGGESLVHTDDASSPRERVRQLRRTAQSIASLSREGYQVLVVYGQAPHLHKVLLREEEASTKTPFDPLDQSVAAAHGTLGYLLDRELRNALRREDIDAPVATVLPQILVSLEDPAFREPAMPVGPFVTPWRARELTRSQRLPMLETPLQGFQRLTPLPKAVELLNLSSIEALLAANHIVIVGSGVPVAVDARGQLIGVEAYLDHDSTAGLIARDTGADLLVFIGDSEQIYQNQGRTDQSPIDDISASELQALEKQGQFDDPDISAKIRASLEFLADGGAGVIMTNTDKLTAALAARAGTRITRSGSKGPIRRQAEFSLTGEVPL